MSSPTALPTIGSAGKNGSNAYSNTIFVLTYLIGNVDAFFSVLTICIILSMLRTKEIKLNGFILIILNQMSCQLLYDIVTAFGNKCASIGSVNQNYLCRQIQFSIVCASGFSIGGWSNVLSASLSYIILTRTTFNIKMIVFYLAFPIYSFGSVLGGMVGWYYPISANVTPLPIYVLVYNYIYNYSRICQCFISLTAVLLTFRELEKMKITRKSILPRDRAMFQLTSHLNLFAISQVCVWCVLCVLTRVSYLNVDFTSSLTN